MVILHRVSYFIIMKNLKIKGTENILLKTDSIGYLETWCKAWVDGKRTPERDGYFSNRQLYCC